MSGRSFLDTNVLIYTDDHDAPEKQRRAIEVYERARRRRTGVVSTQVLQEYFVGATRKLGVEAAVARRKVELFAHLDLVRIDLGTILAAIDFQRLHQVSFWDALIVQAALAGGCATLLSEDMQHGRRIDGLEIVNPFL
ncbi:MAG TPA: PIN domain-containing protein [Gemmatimonadales bacterium]|nr:PIN domain-containing protein [Gemmatimonadales bacterium]